MVADLARPGGLFGTAVHAEKAGDIIKKQAPLSSIVQGGGKRRRWLVMLPI
jgi:hypothetical protein